MGFFRFHLRSNEYRHLKVALAELADDVGKLTDLYTRIDNRQRSGLRNKPAPADPRASECGPCADGGGVPQLSLPMVDGEDRTKLREQLHGLAKARGLR